jgi:hypothetical protein
MFSDVDMMRQTREEMAEVLTGATPKVKGRAARSPRIPSGHGNVWRSLDAAVRAAAREKYNRETGEEARRQEMYANSDWRL